MYLTLEQTIVYIKFYNRLHAQLAKLQGNNYYGAWAYGAIAHYAILLTLRYFRFYAL